MRYPTRAAHFHSNIYAYELNYTLFYRVLRDCCLGEDGYERRERRLFLPELLCVLDDEVAFTFFELFEAVADLAVVRGP